MEKWQWLQYLPEIVTALGLVWAVLKVHGKITSWLEVKEWKFKDRIESILERAVTIVTKDYVEEIKKGRADGKLTREEADAAMKLALEKFKELAKEDGLDLIKAAAVEYLPGLIEKILNRQKAKK